MAEVAQYSAEDLTKIAGAVTLTGAAIAMTDFGIVSTAIEAVALAKEIGSAAQKYPNNSVIQALFSREALEKIKSEHPAKLEVKAEDMQPGKAIETAIAKINEAIAVMQGKATEEEIQEYKTFVYDCANQVANAAGSGLFGSGTKVSESEAAALKQLQAALGLS